MDTVRRIILSGCNGHMGRKVAELCAADGALSVVAGFDVLGVGGRDFPVFAAPQDCTVPADAVIDFSSPAALEPLLAFCQKRRVPAVLATTGYSDEQVEQIKEAARVIPIFRSANMSLGVNLLLDLVKKAAAVLGGDFDIEIVERHHSRKVDAPSGTAKMLADAAAESLSYAPAYVYSREAVRRPRDRREIGLSSVRGGTIVGDHEVIFAGRDEVFELHHHAASRDIFAIGAIRAAKFLCTVEEPGLYDMSALVGELC